MQILQFFFSHSSVLEQTIILMTENVGHHSTTAGVSIVPTLNPAYSILSKPNPIYEEFPEDVTIENETSTTEGGADTGDNYTYINNELHPKGYTNDPGNKGNNDDKCRVNISSFPEGDRSAHKTVKKKIRDKDYDINDDLFPEETQSTAQTTRKEDTRSNIGQNQSVDMAEEKNHGEETDSILDEEGYLKVEG